MHTFEYNGTLDEPLAEIASFELELDSTDRLSQKALSLSGLSIRFPPPLKAGLLLVKLILFGDPSFADDL